MQPFTFNTARSIVFRRGAAADLGAIAAPVTGKRVLFVTDPGLTKLGLYDEAMEALQAQGITVALFDSVEPDPTQATLVRAIAAGKDADVTGVIGFGGGSSLDVAKLAALILGSGEDLEGAWGVANAKGPRLPLILVPTTAGTGSEVTPVSIITVGAEEKRGVSSPVILPDIAVLDPDLTLGLPGPITAATGIDAMVHAIEAYTSANPNNNPLSRMLACEALRLLGANIETVMQSPKNADARGAMLLGSLLAGQAFGNSPVAAVHALAYPLGGTFHIPHGLSNALVLPHVLRFNADAAYADYADLAPLIFPDLARINDARARCSAFSEEIAQLSARLYLPQRLRDVDVPESAVPKLAEDAMLQTRLLVNNPRPLTLSDAQDIYSAAW